MNFNQLQPVTMSKSNQKRERYENFTYKEYSCSDLLSICEQSTSKVPDVEINLFCSESESSIDDIWDEPVFPCAKKSKTDQQKTLSLPAQTQTQNVPPNSPMNAPSTSSENTNPFVSYLLRIWSEQKFNSPRINTLHQGTGAPGVMESPALVLEDPGAAPMSYEEEDQNSESDNTDFQIVPDFEDPSASQATNDEEDTDDYSSQRSRVLNSCVAADHIVPVRFLEE